MKSLLFGLAAAATLAVAAPALAHDEDEAWHVDSYSSFGQQYQHIQEGIRHGISDGSYTRWQAQRYYRELQTIRARADWEERTGDFDPEEISQSLEQLHARMHVAHERGHDRLDAQANDWNTRSQRGYYGYRPYNGETGYYGYRPNTSYRTYTYSYRPNRW